MSERNGVPPDAGASYLGAYTLRNEWVVWLLRNDPHLLTLAPGDLHRTDVGPAPKCTASAEIYSDGQGWHAPMHLREDGPRERCDRPMLYRPGFWCCYQHGETVRIRYFLKVPKMRLYDDAGDPVRDVLALIGDDVDVEYREGKWRVTEVGR